MKVLITGMRGTVGTALQHYLASQGVDCVAWDRQQASWQDFEGMLAYLQRIQPTMLFHLASDSQPTGVANEGWRVTVDWTRDLAYLAYELGIRFLFTSSVMVFTDQAKGYFTVNSQPDAAEGYGYEKWVGEQEALRVNPEAVIARLGWQIGQAGNNNMVDFCNRQMEREGRILASQRWYPACSFLEDTVEALFRLAQQGRGLYLVDSNAGWTFYQIVEALNQALGADWVVQPSNDFIYDQRMVDPRVRMPWLDVRLPGLSPLR
ncbi:MAG: sugar nucleotide-binding protein [Anaerolineae bacterium]|nr:sugar nucleotide-binding protein [Anaerolineae bacterium]